MHEILLHSASCQLDELHDQLVVNNPWRFGQRVGKVTVAYRHPSFNGGFSGCLEDDATPDFDGVVSEALVNAAHESRRWAGARPRAGRPIHFALQGHPANAAAGSAAAMSSNNSARAGVARAARRRAPTAHRRSTEVGFPRCRPGMVCCSRLPRARPWPGWRRGEW